MRRSQRLKLIEIRADGNAVYEDMDSLYPSRVVCPPGPEARRCLPLPGPGPMYMLTSDVEEILQPGQVVPVSHLDELIRKFKEPRMVPCLR